MSIAETKSTKIVDVVVVGAGPYGLSIAAHLNAFGVNFRVFGNPMSAWAEQMPAGMKLKSEGFASSLSEPGSHFTLREYCRQQGVPYRDLDLPVPLETFVAYGMAFQRRFVPNLEKQMIASIDRTSAGFQITLANGERFLARKVVMAVGITQFAYVPEELRSLSADLVTHSSAHHDLGHFNGRRVAVVGAGASALDIASLLHRAGAIVEVIARGLDIRFHTPPRKRSLWERVSSPTTGIGMGWDLFFYVNAPHLFRYLPERLRLNRVRKTLGPAPGWFVRDQVIGKLPTHLNTTVVGARAERNGVTLELSDGTETRTSWFEHVIAATGYRVDVAKLNMLTPEIRQDIRLTGHSPRLTAKFESSVPGLYFVGVSAANTFGPLMRFAVGTHFTAPRLAAHLAKNGTRMQKRKHPEVNEAALERGYSNLTIPLQK